MVTNDFNADLRNPIIQQTPSDSGVACLATIIQHYGGEYALEKIKELCSTTAKGTTLLGLYRAAQQLGFNVKGERIEDVKDLRELHVPAVLHVEKNTFNYFLVFYGYDNKNDKFIIGDPAKGIVNYTAENLEQIWQTKSLLKLSPNQTFVKKSIEKERKRKLLSDLIKEDLDIWVISTFLGLVISLICLSSAVFIKNFFDVILPSGNQQKRMLDFLWIALIMLVYSAVGYWRNIMRVRHGMQFNSRVVERFYKSLLQLPKSFFDAKKDNEFSARRRDIKLLQTTLGTVSVDIVSDALRVMILLTACFTYSATIGAFALSIIPIHLFIIHLFNDKILRSQKKVIESNALVEAHYMESVNSITDIKALNKEDFFQSAHRNLYDKFQRKQFQFNKLKIQLTFTSEVVSVMVVVMIFGLSSEMVLTKDLTIGEMVALFFMSGCIIHSLSRLAASNSIIQEAWVAFNRLYEFVSTQLESFTTSPFLETPEDKYHFNEHFRLKFKDVSFRFPGRKQLLRNVSFKAKRGEIISILGESGSGKTTLLQILQKFYTQKSGKIEVNSIDLAKLPSKEWRNMVGVVPQEVKIFNNNLLHNLTLSDHPEDIDDVIEFCNRYGFSPYFESLKQSYLTILGDDGINISEGQKQLVALARALYRKPQLLILDDATSAMDSKMEKFVFDLLQKLKTSMAIIYLTHRAAIAQKTDHIFILEEGEITASGTPEELRHSENTFSKSVREFTF